jgi:osmoprotectant transport system permease protein
VDELVENPGGLMRLLGDVFDFLTTRSNYAGEDGIWALTVAHLQISIQAVALAAIISIPVAMYVGHKRRFEFIAVTVGNLGRALPSFGVLGLTLGPTLNWPGDFGYWPTFVALFLLSIPPILTNTYVGIKAIDRDTLEAARGMGMTERDVLLKLELPLSAPLLVTGLRTATVQAVATATLGALLGLNNLGRYIVDGIAVQQFDEVFAGALLVAVLAIFIDVAFGALQRVATPRTASSRKTVRRLPSASGPPDMRDASLTAARG